MEILVCIKQVPGSNKVEVDPVTGVLKRNGADSKMNPYDLYALECGMKLKEQYGGRVSVITMGPPPAATIIREAFAMGADEGALVSDRAFGGADVLATSYTLAQGIKKMGNFDVIICGLQTTDGDTAQVGPEVSEALDIPCVCNVAKIDKVEDNAITMMGFDDGAIALNETGFVSRGYPMSLEVGGEDGWVRFDNTGVHKSTKATGLKFTEVPLEPAKPEPIVQFLTGKILPGCGMTEAKHLTEMMVGAYKNRV